MPIAQVKNNGLLDTWGRRNRKLEDIKCKECGKTFRPLRYSSKYCSRKCSWANNGGHNKKPETWWIDNKGYLVGRVWIDGKRVFKRKARWIMENHLGRKLSKYEDVHHINENKVDNRIENIVIISHGGHSSKATMGLQIADYCNWAIWRKWETKDLTVYKNIAKGLKSEFPIFESGKIYYY